MNKYFLTFIVSIIIGVSLIGLPYYLLPAGSYVPKRIPALGYFMPKSPAAWFFLILGLTFLAIAIASALKLKRQG